MSIITISNRQRGCAQLEREKRISALEVRVRQCEERCRRLLWHLGDASNRGLHGRYESFRRDLLRANEELRIARVVLRETCNA